MILSVAAKSASLKERRWRGWKLWIKNHEDLPHNRIIRIVEDQENVRIQVTKRSMRRRRLSRGCRCRSLSSPREQEQYRVIFCIWALGHL
jgi:hypothetical protein